MVDTETLCISHLLGISIMEYVVATLKSLASGMSDSTSQSTATTTPQKALVSLFVLSGIYFLLSKVLSFVRLIFSLFIIPGKPVGLLSPLNSIKCSSVFIFFLNFLWLNQKKN